MKVIARITLLLLAAILPATASAAIKTLASYPEIEKYIGPGHTPKGPSQIKFMKEPGMYLALSDDGKRIVKHDCRTGKEVETLLDITHTRETTVDKIEGFMIDDAATRILIYNHSRPIYRHSFEATYYVYEIRSRILKPLSDRFERQQAPLFSPNGRIVAFAAEDGNIHLKKLDFWVEINVTEDGKKNSIINGIPDWVYQEEFSTQSSMAWSPDSETLCFLKYNETDVPTYSFPLYEGSCNPMEQYALYPGAFTYKYPVAGQPNSVVTLHSYDVDTRKTKPIAIKDPQLHYIPRITFAHSSDRLMVVTLNRAQTRMEVYAVNPKSTVSKSVLVEEWKAWLAPETFENITFEPDHFVVMSSRTGYMHLYQYSYAGALQRTITSGNYDVDAYYGYDAATGAYYYRSDANSPLDRTVYRLDRKGKQEAISPAEGTASARFSPDLGYYVMSYSNSTTPTQYKFCSSRQAKPLRTLEDNAEYASRYASAPKPEFFTMPTEGGITLNGYIIKPTGFSASKRYPVIMVQYSGPGSQQVTNSWSMGCEKYFATQGYVVVCVDGRGTGGRGREFMDVVYKRLGYYETIDQIAAARYAANLPYTDPDRIAIYGWSFGGYESIMAASHPDAPYAAAVAVAPVTDWRYYDSIYTERYMLTPQENEGGYDQASTFAGISTRKCPLLLIHGTADDNVHLYNTIQYEAEAQAQGRWTDMLLFPNMNHSINGCNSRQLVYARILSYLESNLR